MKYTDIPEKIRNELFMDEIVFGNAYCIKSSNGTYERIHPSKVRFNFETKKFEVESEVFNPTDEQINGLIKDCEFKHNGE